MDDKAQSSTFDGSRTLDNSEYSPSSQPDFVKQEGADYLRSCGLTVPYEDILQPWMLDDPKKLITPTEDPTDITSFAGLPECAVPSRISSPEKWEIRAHSLALIQDACRRPSEVDAEGYIRQIRQREEANNIRGLKLELPLLRTDNEIDLRSYKDGIAAAHEVRLSDARVVLEPCDDEKDEGLGFPSRAYNFDKKIVQSVEDEKFEVSKESFQTLLKYLQADWTMTDQEAMLRSQVNYTGLKLCEPLTPPLTPVLADLEPFVPDEDTCTIPQPSDPSSLLSGDLREAENRIFGADEPVPSSIDIEKLNDNTTEMNAVPIAKVVQKRDSLKVEEPLFPAVVEDQTNMEPDFGKIRHDTSIDLTVEDDGQCQANDIALAESLKKTAPGVMLQIEQEKLEPLDATIRVTPPVLDFSVAEPDWCKLGDPLAIFKSILRDCNVDFGCVRWSKKLVDETRMNWRIWTADNPRPAVEQPISDTILLAAYLEQSDSASIPTSSNYVHKKPGLAILRDNGDDDDEELEPRTAPGQHAAPKSDWTTLLKKRKLSHHHDDIMNKGKDRVFNSTCTLLPPGNLLVQEEGSAATLLENYLEMHVPKKSKLEHSPFFKTTTSLSVQRARLSEKNCDISGTAETDSTMPAANFDVPDLQTGQRMVCPEIPHLNGGIKMIVAVHLPRRFITHVTRLLPGLEMVDRDFNAHNATEWVPGSVGRIEISSTLADEADLIPSPSTGIILTTLIKVRQKQIPGAKRKTAHLSARVEGIAARYERLVILVSEDNKLDEGANAMSATDAAALSGFQAFCAALPAEIMVLYIGGGIETLAKWTAAIAVRYASGSQHLQHFLTEEETHWELFLRRAGMNAYAAQVVIGMLRTPDLKSWVNHGPVYGLPRFVKMAHEERCAVFEVVLGGRRVLTRVGRIVDASWLDVRGREQ